MTFDADVVAGAWFVMEISLRSLVAAAAVAVVLRVLRVRAAAVLHTAWSTVLFAMLLMPVLLSIVPALPVPVPASARAFLGVDSRMEPPSSFVARDATQTRPVITATPVSRDSDALRSLDQRPPSVTEAGAARRWLPMVLLGVYAAGVVLLVARLVYGWCLASAMIRRAQRGGAIPVNVPARVYQSSEATVPMTVGAIRPVIVVPLTWRSWEADTLAAIIAHEAAHVRRRDASIAFVAHVNRAIFWFHPLAWWLERKLAVTAEHACDEAAARAIAAPRRYAEILLDMAELVRRHRGRLAWQAVGVHGPGLLDRRINRLLRGEAFIGASRATKIAAAIGCLLAITAVIACRQQIAVAPLREDPELAKRLAERVGLTKQFEAARDMTQEQADAVEERLASNPQDFDARKQLVTYYSASSKVAWDKKVPGLRRHALWLIEHHPEHDVYAPALSPQFDPQGFATAKKLWEAHVARPDVSPFLVYRAAMFFAPQDKPYAEQLIRRGMAMDPESVALKARLPPNVGAYQWPIQLASLYGAALRGSESVWGTYNDLRTRPEWVNSPYAIKVRRELETATDAKLLANVGSYLVRSKEPIKDPAIKQALDDARTLGIRYLERALELEPNLAFARAVLVNLRSSERTTDIDRLAKRAHEGYMIAEDIVEHVNKDAVTGKQRRDEAKARAEEVLKLAAAHSQDPAYSAAIMTAHHVLALAAIRDGDRERAIDHLRESVKVPTSEQIQYAPPSSWSRPVNRLLRLGERERVAEFFEALARLTIRERDRLLQDAQAIRQGRMTTSYQSMVAREGH